MSKSTIADLLVAAIKQAGVKRIYGLAGDSLNALTESIRKDKDIDWVHVRHEEVAAFAAGAEAHLTGSLAVCAGSCGPGNLHLINGLYDCQRSRVPVLAIAGHIPSAEIGRNYFQETHPENLFQECSHFCELVSGPGQLPGVLETAIRIAIAKSGVSVIVLPGDVAMVPAPAAKLSPSLIPAPALTRPQDRELDELAKLLNDADRVTLLCGRGCFGHHTPLMRLADALKSPIVHALGGKEGVEWDNPFDVGMTGLIGFSSGYHAMMEGDLLLMLGTDFPYRQFYPSDCQDRTGRPARREPRPPLPDRSGPGGRRGRHDRRAAAAVDAENRPRPPRREPVELPQGARGPRRAGGRQAWRNHAPAIRRQRR